VKTIKTGRSELRMAVR